MEDYYGILGISPNASEEEVKKAYRNLIKVWHPDVCSKPNAHEQSVKIIEAHKILSNPQTRSEYDYLRNHHQRAHTSQSTTADSNRDSNFARAQQAARKQAEEYVQKGLEELLDMLLAAGRYVWKGEKSFSSKEFSFSSRVATGFKGFLLLTMVILTFTGVAAPVTIPVGFLAAKSLFHEGKFIGIGTLLGSTLMVVLSIVLFVVFVSSILFR